MNETQSATLGRLVDAKGLLEILFAESCRPSLRWLRTQQKRRAIPSVRIGRLVFFDPDATLAALNRTKGSFDGRVARGEFSKRSHLIQAAK